MKRNLYAVLILLFLGGVLGGCRLYVRHTTQQLQSRVQSAYEQTLRQEYSGARRSFRDAQRECRKASKILGWMVRRTALERVNETMAVLAEYANAENQADLAVETARVCEQIEQLENSFWGSF